jgi:hypothetical protein
MALNLDRHSKYVKRFSDAKAWLGLQRFLC